MSIPTLTKLDVNGGDTVFDVESVVNNAVDYAIQAGEMSGSQLFRLTTQNGTQVDVPVPEAQGGILSGLALTFTGHLAASIAAGNFQGDGASQSVGSAMPIAFAARHASFPRIDVVYGDIDTPDTIGVVQGTAAAAPTVPALSAGQVPLYYVWIVSVAEHPVAVLAPLQDFILATCATQSRPVELIALVGDCGVARLAIKLKSIDYDPTTEFVIADRVFVDPNGAPLTIPLPSPVDYDGLCIRFWDSSGTASSFTIDFDAGAFTINTAAAAAEINADYGSFTLEAHGGAWYGKA